MKKSVKPSIDPTLLYSLTNEWSFERMNAMELRNIGKAERGSGWLAVVCTIACLLAPFVAPATGSDLIMLSVIMFPLTGFFAFCSVITFKKERERDEEWNCLLREHRDNCAALGLDPEDTIENMVKQLKEQLVSCAVVQLEVTKSNHHPDYIKKEIANIKENIRFLVDTGHDTLKRHFAPSGMLYQEIYAEAEKRFAAGSLTN
ncbi:MAG TPA: hypothetical protein VIR98_03460 [Candidatus Paceibacterota bacterium]|jgi:hypothetical protein